MTVTTPVKSEEVRSAPPIKYFVLSKISACTKLLSMKSTVLSKYKPIKGFQDILSICIIV